MDLYWKFKIGVQMSSSKNDNLYFRFMNIIHVLSKEVILLAMTFRYKILKIV